MVMRVTKEAVGFVSAARIKYGISGERGSDRTNAAR